MELRRPAAAGVYQNVLKGDFDSRNLTNVTSKTASTDSTSAAFATCHANYYGSYGPPFCHAQAKALFDSMR